MSVSSLRSPAFLKSILMRSSPLCAKYSLIVVKRENIGIFVECVTSAPPVPFHVSVPLAVPMANMVSGICASSLCCDDAVTETSYQPGSITVSAKL